MMSAFVKKEILEDPDVATNVSDEKEDRFLKVYFTGSSDDVLIEEDGRVSFEDITLIDSSSVGLFIQNDAIRRLLNPMDGYFEEPKEKWESFQVYAVSTNQFEIILKERVANADESLQNDAKPVIKTEPAADHESYDSNIPSSSTLAYASGVVQSVEKAKVNVSGEPTTKDVLDACNESLENDAKTVIKTEPAADHESYDSNIPSSSTLAYASGVVQSVEKAKVNVSGEPTAKDVLDAYKVSSRNQLKFMLCRGDKSYFTTYFHIMNSFKRTMIANPNNEIVRVLHWAKVSGTLVKTFDPTASKECDICNIRKNTFNVAHLLSKIHATEYQKRFHADPPQIALLLEPEIYMKFITPKQLSSLKFAEYKELEESPEFSIEGLSSGILEDAFKYKYSLIRTILAKKLKLNYKETFSMQKLINLKRNVHELKDHYDEVKKCKVCKLKSTQIAAHHIFAFKHFKRALNQEELDFICKGLFLLDSKPEPDVPAWSTTRKRVQQTVDDSESEKKRIKMEQFGANIL